MGGQGEDDVDEDTDFDFDCGDDDDDDDDDTDEDHRGSRQDRPTRSHLRSWGQGPGGGGYL